MKKPNFKDWGPIEITIIAAIILVVGMVLTCEISTNVTIGEPPSKLQSTYTGWVKIHPDAPKLTFDEWKQLYSRGMLRKYK